MNPRIRLFSLLCIALTTSLALYSCKSKEPTLLQKEGPIGGVVASKIPASSIFFMVNNTATEAYKKLKSSPQYSASLRLTKAIQDSIKNNDAENASDSEKSQIQAVFQSLQDSGMVPSSEKDSDLFAETVAFGDDSEGRINLALYASAADGKNIKKAIEPLLESLKKMNMKTEAQNFGSIAGYKMEINQANTPAVFTSIYAAATDDRLAIASSKKLVENLFNPEFKGGLNEIRARGAFQEAIKNVAAPSGQYSLGYLDVQKALQVLSATPSAQLNLDAWKASPADTIVFANSFEQTISTDIAAVVNARDETQKAWFNALSGKGKQSLMKKLPANMVFYAGIDGSLVARAQELSTDASSQEQDATPIQMVTSRFKDFGNIGVGVRSAAAENPFPDLLFLAETAKTDETMKIMEEQLDGLVKSFGLPVSPWTDKEIAGLKTRLIKSPIGVGIFLAPVNGAVVMTSSEQCLGSVAKTATGSESSLEQVIPSDFAKYLSEASVPAVAYINFSELATMLESLQGTLAAFSGGSTQIDTAQLQELKGMGTLSLALSYSQPVIRLHAALGEQKRSK